MQQKVINLLIVCEFAIYRAVERRFFVFRGDVIIAPIIIRFDFVYIFLYVFFIENRTKKSSQRIFERMCSALAYFCILQISGDDILQLIEVRAILSPTKTKIKPSGFIQTIKGNEYTELASS